MNPLYCAVQTRCASLDRRIVELLKIHRPDFTCFPEYFLFDHEKNIFREDIYSELVKLSWDIESIIVAGTVPIVKDDRIYNSAIVLYRGRLLGTYHKQNPYGSEHERGIVGGRDDALFLTENLTFSVVICADILNRELIYRLSRYELDAIAVPTNSPKKRDDSIEDKKKRDREIFLKVAQRTSAIIVKSCATGKAGNRELQGRSLICHPDGFIKRAPFDAEERELMLLMDKEKNSDIVFID